MNGLWLSVAFSLVLSGSTVPTGAQQSPELGPEMSGQVKGREAVREASSSVDDGDETVARASKDILPKPRVDKSTPYDTFGLSYSEARQDGERVWHDAEICLESTCIFESTGALKNRMRESGRYRVSLWHLHRRGLRPIKYVEKQRAEEYVLVNRILQQSHNRRVFDLTARFEQGLENTIHIYGLLLQLAFRDGDPLIIEVQDREFPDAYRSYIFRFHQEGFSVALDLALLVPINAWRVPKPVPDYQNSTIGGALSLAFRRSQDPRDPRNRWDTFFQHVHPTFFLAFLQRSLHAGRFVLEESGEVWRDEEHQVVIDEQNDIFIGLGVTFFDFLFLGWGANMIHAPRTTGPFVGFHLIKVIGFLTRLSTKDPTRWVDYIAEEKDIREREGSPLPEEHP